MFTAAQFTPTKWDSAEDKAKFANHFVRFVKSDFKRTLFYHWFYTRLSLSFRHIAHFNDHGFYEEWFSTTERKLEFLRYTNTFSPVGDPEWTYCDVEQAIVEWLHTQEGRSYLDLYRLAAAVELGRAERAELARLQAKYGGG